MYCAFSFYLNLLTLALRTLLRNKNFFKRPIDMFLDEANLCATLLKAMEHTGRKVGVFDIIVFK